MSAAPARAFMTIGEVLGKLRPDFPDITISKIRFLESEGLIEPARTSAGYRKFTYADLECLRYILRAQRDHYLPLKVIKENLDAVDQGGPPPTGSAGLRAPRPLVPADNEQDAPPAPGAEQPSVRLTRAQLLDACGLDEGQLRDLETYGLINASVGRAPYDENALRIAKLAAELFGFGLEPRHLRAAKSAADREAGLVEQVVAPLLRQSDPDASTRAEETAADIAALSVKLHTALVQSELKAVLGR